MSESPRYSHSTTRESVGAKISVVFDPGQVMDEFVIVAGEPRGLPRVRVDPEVFTPSAMRRDVQPDFTAACLDRVDKNLPNFHEELLG